MFLNDEVTSKQQWNAFLARSANGGSITASFEYSDGHNFVFVIRKINEKQITINGYDVQNLTPTEVFANKAKQTKPYTINIPKNMASLQVVLMQVLCNYAKTLIAKDAVT